MASADVSRQVFYSIMVHRICHLHHMSVRPPLLRTFSFHLIPVCLLRAFPDSFRTLIGFVISSMPTRLISSFCSSGQMFAASFPQIPFCNGQPCSWLYTSRYRACYGLAPVRECSCWANKRKPPTIQ